MSDLFSMIRAYTSQTKSLENRFSNTLCETRRIKLEMHRSEVEVSTKKHDLGCAGG